MSWSCPSLASAPVWAALLDLTPAQPLVFSAVSSCSSSLFQVLDAGGQGWVGEQSVPGRQWHVWAALQPTQQAVMVLQSTFTWQVSAQLSEAVIKLI